MPELLVDTWYFVARLDRFDPHHRVARQLEAKYRDALVTHDGVLIEVLTYFSGWGSFARREAVSSVRQAQRQCAVEPFDRRLFDGALRLYEERLDKKYSLTDCASMVLMRERGITNVLTNDHHFAQEGFTIVNA